MRSGLYSPQVKGSRKEKSTVREDQSLAEMGNEVLMHQARVRADQSGEPIEEAMEAVVNTEAGKQLRDRHHGEESVEQAQVGVARERARERVEDLGKRLERPLSSPRTVNGTTFLELRLNAPWCIGQK